VSKHGTVYEKSSKKVPGVAETFVTVKVSIKNPPCCCGRFVEEELTQALYSKSNHLSNSATRSMGVDQSNIQYPEGEGNSVS